jgi:hypothetical protein
MAISITPNALRFDLEKNELASQILSIKNLGSEPAQIQITLDDQRLGRYVSIDPTSAVLAAGGEQNFTVKVEGKRNFSTELGILSSPGANAGLQIASGIKIPLTVKIPASADIYSYLIPLILAFGFVSMIYLWRKRKSA